MPSALVDTRSNQVVGEARSARFWSDEQVVHDADPACAERVPAPVDGREPERHTLGAARDELHSFSVWIGDQSP